MTSRYGPLRLPFDNPSVQLTIITVTAATAVCCEQVMPSAVYQLFVRLEVLNAASNKIKVIDPDIQHFAQLKVRRTSASQPVPITPHRTHAGLSSFAPVPTGAGYVGQPAERDPSGAGRGQVAAAALAGQQPSANAVAR